MEIIKKGNVVKNFDIKEKNDLIKKYIDERMTIQKISKIYKCDRGIIERKLKKYDIIKNFDIKEKNDLIKKYIDERMTIQKISKIYKCDRFVIERKLKKYNISIRSYGAFLIDENGKSLNSKKLKGEISKNEYKSEWAKNKGHKNYNEYYKYLIEEKRKKGESSENCMWTKDELEDLYAYNKQNLTAVHIGKIHKPPVGSNIIGKWIDIYDIEKKTSFELHGGENNGNWQDGISNEYCEEFTPKIKEQVRERWYRRCVLCNRTEKEEGQKISVHHVDYNKNQGCDSTEWKLITLCNYDNLTTVNKNRSYYEYLFTNFIMIRKTLEEFDHKIDYKSIGMIDERCDILDKLKYKNKKIYNDFKYDWRSLGI